MRELTLAEFADWLRSQPADTRYEAKGKGRRSGRSCNCPVARFIGNGVSVTDTGIMSVDLDEITPVPTWAADFMHTFDNMNPEANPGWGITQEEALKALDTVIAKHGPVAA